MPGPPPASDAPVLVTGASGFIAQHIVLRLLADGYRVRGTVRSALRADDVMALAAEHHGDMGRLEIVTADLRSDRGWREAVHGCRYVLHVASPVPLRPPRDANDLIAPARDGALRVLDAAVAAGVERVVLTSSVAAVIYGHARDGRRTYDEHDWSRLTAGVGAYERSKTIAERAAWRHAAALPAGDRIELVTVNPGMVFGPILGPDFSTSGEIVRKLLRRDLPGCPDVGWAPVDVRDVADAHIAAMTTPAAAGKRFIVAIEHASLRDIAIILDRRYRGRGYRIRTNPMPGWLLRVVSVWDRTARLAVHDLGKRQDVSSRRARQLLGWRPRPLEEMVVAMADSMIVHGVV